eukprot:gene384-biopygen3108
MHKGWVFHRHAHATPPPPPIVHPTNSTREHVYSTVGAGRTRTPRKKGTQRTRTGHGQRLSPGNFPGAAVNVTNRRLKCTIRLAGARTDRSRGNMARAATATRPPTVAQKAGARAGEPRPARQRAPKGNEETQKGPVPPRNRGATENQDYLQQWVTRQQRRGRNGAGTGYVFPGVASPPARSQPGFVGPSWARCAGPRVWNVAWGGGLQETRCHARRVPDVAQPPIELNWCIVYGALCMLAERADDTHVPRHVGVGEAPPPVGVAEFPHATAEDEVHLLMELPPGEVRGVREDRCGAVDGFRGVDGEQPQLPLEHAAELHRTDDELLGPSWRRGHILVVRRWAAPEAAPLRLRHLRYILN